LVLDPRLIAEERTMARRGVFVRGEEVAFL
jgi:hypothetical protein